MPVTIETRDKVQTLTLDRPEALNAFNDAMYKAVGDALSAAAVDDEISVVIITGTGRAFSAGQDLGEMGDDSRREQGIVGQFGYFIKTVATFPKPLLAAVNGIGVGIGLTLLPHCDIVYMSADARLRAPFARLGVTVEAGNSYLLPKVLGWANAANILFTGKWIDAPEAKEMGLVFAVSAPDQLLGDVMAKAAEIAAMPLVSLIATKELMIEHRAEGFARARDSEDKAFARLTGAPANREAVTAFLEKREPDFTNLPKN